MKPELTGKRLEFRYQQSSDHDLSITTQVHYTGTNPQEVCRAFFFDSFYLPDAPVLWAVTCTSEQNHFSGGPGSFFAIEGFRPSHLALFPRLGNTFHLEWEEDLIKGRMHGPLWSANWYSRFETISDGCKMIEEFHIEAIPDPGDLVAFMDSPLQLLFNTWAWTSNRLPMVGELNKLLAARMCANLHKLHAPYHETIPKRIAALRQGST